MCLVVAKTLLKRRAAGSSAVGRHNDDEVFTMVSKSMRDVYVHAGLARRLLPPASGHCGSPAANHHSHEVRRPGIGLSSSCLNVTCDCVVPAFSTRMSDGYHCEICAGDDVHHEV